MAATTRLATVEDAYAIAAAHVRAWQVAYEGIVPDDFLAGLDIDRRAEYWRVNLSEAVLPNGMPAPVNYVAEVGSEVVGFVCVGCFREAITDSTLAELWAIYVLPDHWGTGAGFALEQEALSHFRRDEVSTAYLWVLEDNAQARRFYERQGWQADEATKAEEIGGISITERRYSITLS